MQNIMETAFTFDEQRNCVVPFQLTQSLHPETLDDRLTSFSYYVLNRNNRTHENLVRSIARPLAVPYVDVSKYRTTTEPVPVLMCKPSGYRTLRYDLTDPDHLEACFIHQANALRWELIRQTLEQIGAKVTVVDSVRPDKPRECLQESFDYSTLEIFTRDAGFIYNGRFFAPSTQITAMAVRSTSNKASSEILRETGYKDFASETAQQSRMRFKELQILNMMKAFSQAGMKIETRRIHSLFDGGNVLPDPNKGLIFVGKSRVKLPPELSRISIAANQQWNQAIAAATGARVIAIDCGEPATPAEADRFHIDMMGSLLPGGELLLDRRNTSQASSERLKKVYGRNILYIDGSNPQFIDDEVEARKITNCPANLVAIGRTLFMPSCSDSLRATLTRRDYSVVSAETLGVYPWLLAINGGSIHCVTQTAPSFG